MQKSHGRHPVNGPMAVCPDAPGRPHDSIEESRSDIKQM